MENYIVRINSYNDTEKIRCGTGIVIGERQILTAKHVTCGNHHTVMIGEQEIDLYSVKENDVAIVLEIQNLQFDHKADCFSLDEILDFDSPWKVEGYISYKQRNHEMNGTGIAYVKEQETNWDSSLVKIATGKSSNYEGMSGAPVVSESRIVGILQCQASNINGALGVRMSSVAQFFELLPRECFKENEYYNQIKTASQNHSDKQIQQNIKSKKYIPDIFVEEREYKENMRFFADPCLFVKKVIRDCKRIDFSLINRFLIKKENAAIDFSGLNENFLPEELEQTIEFLLQKLSYAIDAIRGVDQYTFKKEMSVETHYKLYGDTFNNSIQFHLRDMLELVAYAKKKYILLTKCAGQGKTNFLCDFTKNFLLRKDYCVWYFNAYDFRDNPMHMLRQKLELQGDYSFAYASKVLMNKWKKNKRPVIIVIDGLNENTTITDFGGCIRDFLEECEKFPWLKIVMSTREEFLKERFGCVEQGSYIERYSHMSMWETTDTFKERIFWGYMNFFNITVRTNTLTRRTYKILTDDILLLRFFCEVHEGKQQIYMYDIYKYDLFRKYLTKKAQEYAAKENVLDAETLLNSLLDKICAYMIQAKTYFDIPVRIFDYNEQRLLTYMLENEVVFKEEQLLQAGLMQRNSVVISFTFDEFRDFCITNYVLTNIYEKEKFIDFWNTMNTENQTIREGVQKYIFLLAKTQYQENLLPIVQELPEYEKLYWEHIWNIEDAYITELDVEMWRKQILEGGLYDHHAVNFLVFRYDCECFAKVNIKLLFDILDEFAKYVERYELFIQTMFGITQRDRYGIERRGHKVVFPFNKLVEFLQRQASDDEWNQIHRELYRLVIYLYELKRYKTLELWEQLYQTSPKLAIELLTEMNWHQSSLVKGNVKDILQYLVENGRNDDYDKEINQLDKQNDFGQGVSFNTIIILPDILGEEE